MTTKPLSRPELEALLRDVGEAGFGHRQPVVEDILASALHYEEKARQATEDRAELEADAGKWRTYMEQNREAQARYREKRRAAKLERRA